MNTIQNGLESESEQKIQIWNTVSCFNDPFQFHFVPLSLEFSIRIWLFGNVSIYVRSEEASDGFLSLSLYLFITHIHKNAENASTLILTRKICSVNMINGKHMRYKWSTPHCDINSFESCTKKTSIEWRKKSGKRKTSFEKCYVTTLFGYVFGYRNFCSHKVRLSRPHRLHCHCHCHPLFRYLSMFEQDTKIILHENFCANFKSISHFAAHMHVIQIVVCVCVWHGRTLLYENNLYGFMFKQITSSEIWVHHLFSCIRSHI